jgi:protoporphyrinogen oxidase
MNWTGREVIIIGAGPAGLTAAFELVKRGILPLVFEKSHLVGGIARTEQYRGYRFDIGGHRFYTQIPEVRALWLEMLADDFLKVPRLSRILYRGRFFHYPIELANALFNLGLWESLCIVLSFCRWKLFPYRVEETFEQWVTNRFGRRLYRLFFKTYTEKVWGIPCSEIRAEWAAQRIKGLSLWTAVRNALVGVREVRSLINEFDYPALGPGMMWERFRDRIAARGGRLWMGADTVAVRHDGGRITGVTVRCDGVTHTRVCGRLLSCMPLDELIARLDPPPPEEVRAAARGLSYRDFILVGLILKRDGLFRDNWIYVHTPGVKVGRIQNFRNWSARMVPEPGKTSVGMEYFCTRGDALWETSDGDLIALARRELVALGLASESDVEDGVVIRQPKAYPIYDADYRAHLGVIRRYLDSFENLQTIGRNGMHRYNNQDHSMLTAILAVRNLMGEAHDLWEVNTERSYYEEFSRQGSSRGDGDLGP